MAISFRRVFFFLLLTFSISWTLYSLGFSQVSTFGPMIAAMALDKLLFRRRAKEALGVSFRVNRWFLLAWLGPFFFALAVFGVSLLVPGVEYTPDKGGAIDRLRLVSPQEFEQRGRQMGAFQASPPVAALMMLLGLGLVNGLTSGAVFAFGEELGWRGFLQREVIGLGFWRSSLLVGVVWGIWHALPIAAGRIHYPEHPIEGIFVMVFSTVLLSPVFAYVRLKSRSVVATSILHGAFNESAPVAILLVRGSDLLIGITGLSGAIVLLLIDVLLYFHCQGRRRKLPTGEEAPLSSDAS